jgi:tRNA(Arg) A34 adenosine deaminase TadA
VNLLRLAAKIAADLRESQRQGFYLAAVGVRSDGAIVQATNKATRGGYNKSVPATHAETRLCRKLDAGAVVYVARVLENGVWGLARPCSRCRARMRSQKVRRVYYTIGPGEYGILDLTAK